MALTLALHVQAAGDGELPLREGPAQPALPRRACAAPLSQRRGALHRLQAVRGDLPGAGHHHRGRAARGRQPAHDALRHRHDEMHLLRLLPGGLPGRCHRRGPEFRVRHRDPRGALLRQGQAAWRTATAGKPRSPRTSPSTRPTDERREGPQPRLPACGEGGFEVRPRRPLSRASAGVRGGEGIARDDPPDRSSSISSPRSRWRRA